jgi:hypothetical protein
MHLRHISPGSSDWMDAMDEESGGRGWEKLAPEERTKLLRERQPLSVRDEDKDRVGRSWASPSEAHRGGLGPL